MASGCSGRTAATGKAASPSASGLAWDAQNSGVQLGIHMHLYASLKSSPVTVVTSASLQPLSSFGLILHGFLPPLLGIDFPCIFFFFCLNSLHNFLLRIDWLLNFNPGMSRTAELATCADVGGKGGENMHAPVSAHVSRERPKSCKPISTLTLIANGFAGSVT